MIRGDLWQGCSSAVRLSLLLEQRCRERCLLRLHPARAGWAAAVLCAVGVPSRGLLQEAAAGVAWCLAELTGRERS